MFVNNYCLPNQMNCIIAPLNGCGGIYLGNVDAAQDPELLGKYQIGAVLSILDYSVQIKGAQKLWIMAEDSEDFPLHKYFDQSIRFIENQSRRTNVLVHCYAGISRSAAVVAAYMMHKYNWSANQTLLHIQSRRRIVSPNQGFIRQLKEYERKLNNGQQQKVLSLKVDNSRPISSMLNYAQPKQQCGSRLDEFTCKLDQFRQELRRKQKVC